MYRVSIVLTWVDFFFWSCLDTSTCMFVCSIWKGLPRCLCKEPPPPLIAGGTVNAYRLYTVLPPPPPTTLVRLNLHFTRIGMVTALQTVLLLLPCMVCLITLPCLLQWCYWLKIQSFTITSGPWESRRRPSATLSTTDTAPSGSSQHATSVGSTRNWASVRRSRWLGVRGESSGW